MSFYFFLKCVSTFLLLGCPLLGWYVGYRGKNVNILKSEVRKVEQQSHQNKLLKEKKIEIKKWKFQDVKVGK